MIIGGGTLLRRHRTDNACYERRQVIMFLPLFVCLLAKYTDDFTSKTLAIAGISCRRVRLSVTSRCSTETAKRRITQTTPHDSPGTLSFLLPKMSAKLKRDDPQRRRQMQVG